MKSIQIRLQTAIIVRIGIILWCGWDTRSNCINCTRTLCPRAALSVISIYYVRNYLDFVLCRPLWLVVGQLISGRLFLTDTSRMCVGVRLPRTDNILWDILFYFYPTLEIKLLINSIFFTYFKMSNKTKCKQIIIQAHIDKRVPISIMFE